MVADPETCRLNGAKSRGAITQRGKDISSRNATKHGLLAQKPPILASEDLESFQGVMQSLVEQYQPINSIEWHLVQTIATCIQRQHRVWAAEAAAGNAKLLPPVETPYTNQKYPVHPSMDLLLKMDWGEFHPQKLNLEHHLLTDFLAQHTADSFPTKWRSKYWPQIWEGWCNRMQAELKYVQTKYPTNDLMDKPSDAKEYSRWLSKLRQVDHPYGRIWFYVLGNKSGSCPRSKSVWEYERSQFINFLQCFQNRVTQINEIEAEVQQEQERYQREIEERRLLTTNPLPEQIALITRYETHIVKQMREAIAELQKLQSERKNQGSMGSFRENV